ncbi:PLP-dependent aminotransferase family protein [Desertihabitans brevis]|uniref:PLP-dependent aminotransferase family protein n=1 Tax=Desertihabitans brevis TaxID=2268447 RepID=A0A367YS38_9ACTN|nr:PLP-dependent aminotransferase family protein [Desertihabitans brevis]RCK68706.1 PLP-dependent aminotransferase family protein [Desertihabitans brevis]
MSTIVVGGVLLPTDPGERSSSRRLATALRRGIQDGLLPDGSVLPPSRALAAELGCSRWLVTEVYGQLVAEGYLVATVGSGTRVRTPAPAATGARQGGPVRTPGRPRFDLSPGVADLRAFPRTQWAAAYRRAVLELPTDSLAGQTLSDSIPARTVITGYLERTRQVRETPAQLVMTTGASAAVGWLARLLATLGHRTVAVEDPSWPGLREAAARNGLRPVPVGVDEEGLRVEELSGRRLRGTRAVIATPAHQFPVGVALSPERRRALVEWAERVDGVVVEDDYDAEFRYDRRPVSSLQGMAPDRVVLVGSLSKSLGPVVALGWAVVPQWLLGRMLLDDLARSVWPGPFTIEAFAGLVDGGAYERHLRTSRLRLRRRRAALLEAVAELLPGCVPGGVAAGMHVPLTLPAGTDAAAVVARARESGVGVADLARYRVRPASGAGLVLGFGNLRDGREREAVARLAGALRG